MKLRPRLLKTALLASVALLLASLPLARLSAASIDDVQVGVAGGYKLGHWTPVRVQLTAESQQTLQLEVAVLDGDGVPASYTAAVQLAAGETASQTVYVRVGRKSDGIEVLLRQDGSASFDSRRVPLPLPMLSTDYWLVVVGADLPLNVATLRRGLTAGSTLHIGHLDSLAELPDRWLGLAGVDQLILTTSQPSFTSAGSERVNRFDVLNDWLHAGGRLVISLGRRGAELVASDDNWADLLPGRLESQLQQWQTEGLEDYAGASQRLRVAPLSGSAMTVLADVDGQVDAFDGLGGTGNRPMIVRSAVGLGQLVFLAVDLDLPPLTGWEAFNRLMEGLLVDSADAGGQGSRGNRSAQVAHVGYTDLSGQLRAALDRFDGVIIVNFYWVAGILVIYLLAIGPLDYYLLRKFNRPTWTWVTFPLLVVGFSLIAFNMSGRLKQQQVRVNQLEIVDLDLKSGRLRATSWFHYYNPVARTIDLSVNWDGLRQAGLAPEATLDHQFSWQGLPGSGLGGLATQARGIIQQPYRHGLPGTGEIHGLPMATASTRSLLATVVGHYQPQYTAELTPDRLAADLSGTFANPLNVTLEDAVLYYADLSFQLPGPLAPGQVVDAGQLSETMRNVQSRLTRGRAGGRRKSSGWSLEDFDVARVAEMLMFHEAAGGRNYTSLTHRYQPWLDLSRHLDLGRAVLVGRAAGPAAELAVAGQAAVPNQKWTFYRLLIPVQADLLP